MKTAISAILAAAALPALSSPAWASPAGREDNSPLVIWAFLAFCALIVIAQVIPAILNARRAAAAEKEARKKEAASTYR
jgi:hypothetical protein